MALLGFVGVLHATPNRGFVGAQHATPIAARRRIYVMGLGRYMPPLPFQHLFPFRVTCFVVELYYAHGADAALATAEGKAYFFYPLIADVVGVAIGRIGVLGHCGEYLCFVPSGEIALDGVP